MLDIKITGGQVYDGSGAIPVRTDVGIRGDRIEALGDLSKADAARTISAGGRAVCPGFIDVHSHSDAYLLIEPSAPSKIHQGITTEIVGNCGASAAPRVGAYQMPSDWRDKHFPGPWSRVAEYRALLEQARPAVNAALLIGHNGIRAGAIGYEGRPAREDEIRAMEKLLEQAIEEGGAGFSTGLIYAPGLFAETQELVRLAHVAARHDRIYTSHMRSEGSRLLEALDETIGIGRQSGARVEVSHLKTSGRKNWPLIDAALNRIRKARESGLEVAADRYPYTASCTDLDVVLPNWASEGGRDTVLRRLKDPGTRRKIREEIVAARGESYWPGVTIGSTFHTDNRRFQGLPLPDVAGMLSMEPVDAVLHLCETDELHTGAIFFGMSEENMWRILAEPYVMIGSDASLRALTGPLSTDHPHPRAYGTFPRFLRAALDGKTVAVPEAIRKMTSWPAEHFRLKDRGRVKEGCFADLVVFDPAGVRDKATYEKPHQLAEGIETVLVNGVVEVVQGRMTGERAGRFLD